MKRGAIVKYECISFLFVTPIVTVLGAITYLLQSQPLPIAYGRGRRLRHGMRGRLFTVVQSCESLSNRRN